MRVGRSAKHPRSYEVTDVGAVEIEPDPSDVALQPKCFSFGAEFGETHSQFLVGVHDEGAAHGDRLVQREPGEQD
jgi:hypothetical protein